MQKIVYFKERADTKICILSVMYVTSLLANLAMGYSYISLGSFIQSGGVFIFPFSLIISTIITELYGSELARKLVLYGIICQLIFAWYAYLVVHLPAPEFLQDKEMFFQVFNPYIRFALASTFSIWIGSQINIILLSKLSELIGGKYFALRSLLSSTVGELLVTIISMVLANFSKMSVANLVYMIGCCFLIKTIISFFAILPASLIVHSIENQSSFDFSFSVTELVNPIKYLRKIFIAAWYAKGYIYNLEAIDLEHKKASLYYKGTKGVVQLNLKNLVLNSEIIDRIRAVDAANIGYYYAKVEGLPRIISLQDNKNKNQNILNILAICRDGKLTIEDISNSIYFKKDPNDLYKNKGMLEKFSSQEALYIGYQAGRMPLSDKKVTHKKNSYLKLLT
ncbi:MAG: queuosine precursor transporter [Legionella sp.]|nr:queuosine precursor transporter [Legionella sp.]